MSHLTLRLFLEVTPWTRVEINGPTQVHTLAGVEVPLALFHPLSHLFDVVVALIARSIAKSVMPELYFGWFLIQSDIEG